jgi:Protein of unknown function (Gmx_para_CXXCG)
MSALKFWRVNHPNYNSDYAHTFMNGALDHPFSLPGVNCPVCKQSWGGSRILPYQCPESLRRRKEIRNSWPISLAEHKKLQMEVLIALRGEGFKIDSLEPGDSLQPCYLDAPSRPRADFLWSSIGSLVVSHRIKDLFEKHAIAEIEFAKVELRKVGKREARLPPPIPVSGEPEDLINETPLLTDTSKIGPYYELIILNESGYPPGRAPKSICSGCGRPDVDDRRRRIVMTPEMWKGDKIFFLATTLYVIVTNELKELLERNNPTNVIFEEI